MEQKIKNLVNPNSRETNTLNRLIIYVVTYHWKISCRLSYVLWLIIKKLNSNSWLLLLGVDIIDVSCKGSSHQALVFSKTFAVFIHHLSTLSFNAPVLSFPRKIVGRGWLWAGGVGQGGAEEES